MLTDDQFNQLTFVLAVRTKDHEYVVRSPENEDAYVALWNTIHEHGVAEKWQGRRYRYWRRGDWKYWYMGALGQSRIINRVKV